MEAVNSITNAAASAAKAVWGDQNKTNGEEPRSGERGDTSKGEPYDKGNLDEPNSTVNTSVDSKAVDAADFSKNTGTAATSDTTPDTPSADLKAKRDVAADTSADQNDVRDPSNPQTHPKSAPTDVNDADDGVNKAQKLDGPGPKPIDEVAREHGGDAGQIQSPPAPDTAKVDKKDDEAKGEELKTVGSGEKYVKTSGLNADGGDFDATKPGAGREADRLMDAKGIHNPNTDTKSKPTETEASPSPSSGKEKKSIGKRIKDKLHRH